MAIPTYEEIMLPLLKLVSSGKTYKTKDYVKELEDIMQLTEEERSKMRKDNKFTVFYDRATWAKTYLKKADLLESPNRGEVKISQRGLEVIKSNITILNNKFLEQYEEFRSFKYSGKDKDDKKSEEGIISNPEIRDSNKTPIESIDENFEIINRTLQDDILERLKNIDFFKFEEIVLDLLIKMGYGGSRVEAKKATKKTGDEGIDGIINEDRLGLDRIYIQAKRWKDTVVGRPEIQKFIGALVGQGAKKGIFITTSTFSKEAISFLDKSNDMKIILVDGQQLAEYMIDFNVGVSVETVYEIKKIDSDYFIEE